MRVIILKPGLGRVEVKDKGKPEDMAKGKLMLILRLNKKTLRHRVSRRRILRAKTRILIAPRPRLRLLQREMLRHKRLARARPSRLRLTYRLKAVSLSGPYFELQMLTKSHFQQSRSEIERVFLCEQVGYT